MKFLELCAQTGIADYIYYKASRPPRWMQKEEQDAWWLGYKEAKNMCIN